MLKVTKRELTGSLRLASNDTTVSLSVDEDCTPIGVISLRNGAKKFVTFVPWDDGKTFKARIILKKTDANEMPGALFHVMLCGVASDQSTNRIPIDADIEAIKRLASAGESDELAEINAKIAELSKAFDSAIKGLSIPKLRIHGPGCTEPGMVPIAIDDNGTFVPGHPFADVVHSVNGVKCIDGSIVIDASMIEYAKGKSVSRYLSDLADAITSVNTLVNSLKDNVVKLTHELNELSLRVSARLDGGAM